MSLSMESARIEREAADWLAKRDSGSWSEADAQAFEQWQSQATSNRIAVIRIEAAWQKADRLKALGAGVPAGEIPPPGSWRLSPERWRSVQRATKPLQILRRKRDPRFEARPAIPSDPSSPTRRLRAWAAVMVLALSGGLFAYLIVGGGSTYRSNIGQIRVVSLSDGSTVTLNTNSVVRVRYSHTERFVDLERGEAFFEDIKDPGRPFVVSTAGQRIVAVGTKFDVFRRAMATRVVVTDGQVNVENFEHGAPVGPMTELSAGSIAQVSFGTVLVRHLALGEAQDYIAWRSGYLRFHDTQLATAVMELNRYNRRQLVIADPAIATLKIGGNVRATNVEAFVHALEEGFPVQATNQGAQIVLTAKRSQ
jgi:transmembrane sensor